MRSISRYLPTMHEGVWAANSGSIQADEAALTSNKPPVQAPFELMPHQLLSITYRDNAALGYFRRPATASGAKRVIA